MALDVSLSHTCEAKENVLRLLLGSVLNQKIGLSVV
jgi:hypothetical protein